MRPSKSLLQLLLLTVLMTPSVVAGSVDQDLPIDEPLKVELWSADLWIHLEPGAMPHLKAQAMIVREDSGEATFTDGPTVELLEDSAGLKILRLAESEAVRLRVELTLDLLQPVKVSGRDLDVTGLENNHLFSNRGGKSFVDVTAAAGVPGGGWSTGCAFADYDRDGDLDLFVSRYVTVSLKALPKFGKGQFCMYREMPVHCGPQGLPGISDLFYRNDGSGRFTEISEQIGVSDPEGLYGLGAVWFDADADGWLDLFVANDTTANFLYMNRKDGTFEEMGLLMGVAVSEDGEPQGSMGIAVGDYLNEGRLSLFVTNFAEEYNALYRSAGDFFTDVSFRSGTALPSLRYVGWGTAFLDYDNDGWLDLLLVNGHVYPQMAQLELDAIAPYRQRRLLYRNRRNGTFEEVSTAAEGPLLAERVSRGTAVGDLNDDGRLDVVVNNRVGKAEVWIGAYPDSSNWLRVRLVGNGKMTDAIGATVHLTTAGQTQMRLVQSGSNYLSQDDMRAHFGLGEATRADKIEVRWPDGSISTQREIAVNQQIVIEQPPLKRPSTASTPQGMKGGV